MLLPRPDQTGAQRWLQQQTLELIRQIQRILFRQQTGFFMAHHLRNASRPSAHHHRAGQKRFNQRESQSFCTAPSWEHGYSAATILPRHFRLGNKRGPDDAGVDPETLSEFLKTIERGTLAQYLELVVN